MSDQDETAILRQHLRDALATIDQQRREIEELTRERDRWLTRMRRLERRVEFAAEALDPRLDATREGS